MSNDAAERAVLWILHTLPSGFMMRSRKGSIRVWSTARRASCA